ncbi:hypothetical protein B0T10DRAFT_283016 [Thelonectria olida]|uniref:Eisosome protein 1 n=1 Tax=Thelonectria olida TaxID=1576542 RepID=A0A9P8W7J8_9HYPO|nr:hypothetical protein B0T10DRAFT_283016 [Thelonectria olida]
MPPQHPAPQSAMIQTSSAPAPGPSSGRLKYANPRDLPSYPSPGLRSDGAAASAAASLGWSNRKPIECWKPDKTSSASAAAVLAKDYKMAPSWEPTSNSDGHKAALLAIGSAKAANKTTTTPKSPHDGWGSSAATQAFNTNRANSTRKVHPSTSSKSLQGQKSLAAAKGAMAKTRPRAISTPAAPQSGSHESYPGESMAASNALSGATLAHQASLRSKSVENAGAVPVTTMTRNMFTSHPPVKLEVDERQNNEKLHATAVEMARKMYLQQQKIVEHTKDSHGQDTTTSQSKPPINLQEAAFKQAQERLAKLQNEYETNRGYSEYYGNSPSARHRFSLTSKLRRRSSSDGDLDDRQQSEVIRQQMSLFSNKLSEVDEQKRKNDRDALMLAAQRNVRAQLQGMDRKVYNETGKVNPTMLTEWELKAHQAANANHAARIENKGKVDIGGGKFMNPDEVDAIASKRVQPILNDINEKAEAERERQAVLKLEEEARKAEIEKEKAREREIKEINKTLRDQAKQEEKAKKAKEKAAKAEQKRQAKEEKRTSKADSTGERDVPNEDVTDDVQEEAVTETPATTAVQTDKRTERRSSNESATSPTSRVRGWIKNRFSRGKSFGDGDKQNDKRRSFLGGAALRDSDLNRSTTSLDNRSASMRDVALAGRANGPDTNDGDSTRDSRGVSPISSNESVKDFVITPPRPIGDHARSSHSPSRFREMIDQ